MVIFHRFCLTFTRPGKLLNQSPSGWVRRPFCNGWFQGFLSTPPKYETIRKAVSTSWCLFYIQSTHQWYNIYINYKCRHISIYICIYIYYICIYVVIGSATSETVHPVATHPAICFAATARIPTSGTSYCRLEGAPLSSWRHLWTTTFTNKPNGDPGHHGCSLWLRRNSHPPASPGLPWSLCLESKASGWSVLDLERMLHEPDWKVRLYIGKSHSQKLLFSDFAGFNLVNQHDIMAYGDGSVASLSEEACLSQRIRSLVLARDLSSAVSSVSRYDPCLSVALRKWASIAFVSESANCAPVCTHLNLVPSSSDSLMAQATNWIRYSEQDGGAVRDIKS